MKKKNSKGKKKKIEIFTKVFTREMTCYLRLFKTYQQKGRNKRKERNRGGKEEYVGRG